MSFIWDQLRQAFQIIGRGDPYLTHLAWVTLKVAVVSTACAVLIGLPFGLVLGVGRFRGRRVLRLLANAGLALPSVIVGMAVLLLTLPQAAFGSLRIEFTITDVYIAQTILAIPYIVALTAAAIQALPPGALAQARALGASRLQVARLALREAKIGFLAAVIAALGAAISEVGAVIIVGANIHGSDQTLASAIVDQFDSYGGAAGQAGYALAMGIVLLVMILVLAAVLTVVQQRTSGIHLRFRAAT